MFSLTYDVDFDCYPTRKAIMRVGKGALGLEVRRETKKSREHMWQKMRRGTPEGGSQRSRFYSCKPPALRATDFTLLLF